MQFSVAVRTARVSQIQAVTGGSATLVIYQGTIPGSAAAAVSGATVLATIALPATFLTSSAGTTTLAGTWSVAASATGTAQFFRIIDSSSNCHVQGTIGTSGADMNLNSVAIGSGQTVQITAFSLTDANA